MLNLKKDLSLDASAEAPVVSLDGLSGKLNTAQGLGGEIGGPTLNGDLPSLSLNKPSADAGAKFNMPSLGLTGPDKNIDLDGTLKAPNVSVSTPKLNTPSASVEKPEIKTGNTKYKTPKFTMPQFNLPQFKTPKGEMDVSSDADLPSVSGNLETPGLNLSAPKLDLKNPDLDLNGPKVDLNGPGVNLGTPNADIQAPSSKIKWPNLKLKGPRVKGPDADLNADLSAPDASLTTPKIDGNVSTPDVDISIPKGDIKSPNLDVQTPNHDIDAPSGKMTWLHKKLKLPRLHGPKSDVDLDANLNTPHVDASLPKVEGGINAPDVDINVPEANLKGPDLNMQTPNLDAESPSGKINWPHMKWRKKGPKADLDIDPDLNTPNFTTPKFEGDINAPNAELHVPKADLNGPNVDFQAPDLGADAPSGKFTWPHKKWNLHKLHGHKTDMDLNADLSTPDVDLSAPKLDGELSTPDVDLNLPKAGVDVKAPGADIEAPSGKIKFPTLKKPKWPKVKGPDVDLDTDVKAPDLNISPQASLDGPDVGVHLPKADVDVEAPNVDLGAPSGKIKWPTLKKPKWLASGLKVNGPDADVSAPDLSLSAPKIDGGINAPDVNLKSPEADLEGPQLDINAPDVDGPSGKFNWLNLKKPTFGTLKGPKGNIDADVKGPDASVTAPGVDLSAPGFSAPTIEAPDVNINMPNADIKGPGVDLNGPDIDADTDLSGGKLKLPKLKLPKFKGTKVKGPELDAGLKAPNIDASLDLPKGGMDAPNVDLKTSDLSLSAPNIGLDATDLDINLPKGDVKGPDVDASAGKVKLPKINIPKFGSSGLTVKGPDLNVDADAKAPNLNLSAPTNKGDFSTPDVDLGADLKDILSAPKTTIDVPDFNLSNPKTNLAKADVNRPSLDLTNADVQGPDLNFTAPNLSLSSPKIDGNLSAPNIDTKLPKAELDVKRPNAQVKTPDLDLDSHLGDFNLPHFKVPTLGLSSPDTEVPSVNPSVEAGIKAPKVSLGTPMADMTVPKLEGDVKGPEAPYIDADLEKSKLKFPKLSFPGSKIKAPGLDSSAQLEVSPDVKVKAPSVEGKISSPDVSVSAPEVKTSLNTPELETTAEADAEVKSTPKSKLRWPFKWGLESNSVTDEEGEGVDSETEVSNAEVEIPVFKTHRLPRSSIEGIGAIEDTLGLLKADTEAKDYVVSKGIRLPIVNATSKAGEKIDIMERLKMAKEKAPSPNVSPTEGKTDIDLKLPAPGLDVSASTEAGDASLIRGGTFKVEKPASALGLVAPEMSTSDENDKLSLSLSNMLGLDIKN